MPSDGDSPADRSTTTSAEVLARTGEEAVGSSTSPPGREALQKHLSAAVLAVGQSRLGPAVIAIRVRFSAEGEARLDAEVEAQAIEILWTRLNDLVRSGEFLARTSDGRFSILLEAAESVFEIETRLTRVLSALHSPIGLDGLSILVQSSAGISRFPEAGRTSEELIANADAALRIAQEKNAPYRFWYDGLGESSQEMRSFERDLAEAIEHDQLELHFQPIVDAGTDEILGMEALARWRRPGHGWVPPLDFFGVANTCGLLDSLEEWVLRRAASTFSNWRRRGISRGRLSINCVPSFMARASFAPMVLSILERQGLDGEAVEFEVGEESFGPGSTVQVESLRSLRESGMRIAIDDFSWGQLSEQQLMQLPVDRLKIAPECLPDFRPDAVATAAGGAVALSIIEVAGKLGLDLSAEAVETEAQRDFLLEHGCRSMQGFLFARPLTPLDAAALLRRGSVGP